MSLIVTSINNDSPSFSQNMEVCRFDWYFSKQSWKRCDAQYSSRGNSMESLQVLIHQYPRHSLTKQFKCTGNKKWKRGCLCQLFVRKFPLCRQLSTIKLLTIAKFSFQLSNDEQHCNETRWSALILRWEAANLVSMNEHIWKNENEKSDRKL